MKTVPTVILKAASKQAFVLQKNSPHIFFGLGIVGTAASTVLACRSTLRLSETLDRAQKEIETVKLLREIPADSDSSEAKIEEIHHRVDTIHVYGRALWSITKLYAPAVIIGGASIALLTGSHVQMARRNSALMAAYAGIQEFLEKYRARVRDEVGEEKELDLYRGSSKELVKTSGGEVVEGTVINPLHVSPYAKFFDEYSVNWVRNPEYNRIFLEVQQAYANHRLKAFGHVFLNEVYDMVGVPRTKAGAVVGWLNGGEGDDYISFGVFDAWNSQFVNGAEPSILLDFNVDGVIYDKI